MYSLISKRYSQKVCLAAYAKPIQATQGREVWCKFKGERLEPPVFRKRPGRPTKNRKRSRGEVRQVPGINAATLSRHGRVMHCNNCKEAGHNSRSCKKPKVSQETATGRKRKAEVGSSSKSQHTPTTKQATAGSQPVVKMGANMAGVSRKNKQIDARRAATGAQKKARKDAENAAGNVVGTDTTADPTTTNQATNQLPNDAAAEVNAPAPNQHFPAAFEVHAPTPNQTQSPPANEEDVAPAPNQIPSSEEEVHAPIQNIVDVDPKRAQAFRRAYRQQQRRLKKRGQQL